MLRLVTISFLSFVNLENVCEDFLLLFQGSCNLKSFIINVSSEQCHPSLPPHLSERVFPSSSPESPEMREADWAVAWDEIGSSKIREEVEILNSTCSIWILSAARTVR